MRFQRINRVCSCLLTSVWVSELRVCCGTDMYAVTQDYRITWRQDLRGRQRCVADMLVHGNQPLYSVAIIISGACGFNHLVICTYKICSLGRDGEVRWCQWFWCIALELSHWRSWRRWWFNCTWWQKYSVGNNNCTRPSGRCTNKQYSHCISIKHINTSQMLQKFVELIYTGKH